LASFCLVTVIAASYTHNRNAWDPSMAEQDYPKCFTIPRSGNEVLQVASTNLDEVLLEISAKRLARFA